ncbi:MAG: TlyA family RNA methyltransferase [Bdellovibrionaceae bacterium]|nr:TlyA family RNA methyltransferase [Pseudobdellovibrionaceae bacterium]
MRLDQWLYVNKMARSRTHAEDMISRGDVQIFIPASQEWRKISKPSYKVDENLLPERVRIESELTKYVSRGGLKLEKALGHLAYSVQNLRVLDVGQSTGGFTDCLLQKGASVVVGVEVGHGQLDPKLKADSRNLTFEGLDIREAEGCSDFMVLTPFPFVVIDASFISLRHILPAVYSLLAEGGRVLALVKPQFELSAQDLDKKGIVRSSAKHQLVQSLITDYVRALPQLQIRDYFQSEEKGKDGNVEFFIFLEKTD